MNHVWHVVLEVAAAFALIAFFAVVNLPRQVVITAAVILIASCAAVGAFRVWR